MNRTKLDKKIREYFETISDYKPSEDENLFEAGVLDSFGVVEFLTFLEEAFKLDLEAEDIVLQNFATLRAIIEFIEKRKKGHSNILF